MLHSDRSFPGTPDWPGNRTGTGPGGEAELVSEGTNEDSSGDEMHFMFEM